MDLEIGDKLEKVSLPESLDSTITHPKPIGTIVTFMRLSKDGDLVVIDETGDKISLAAKYLKHWKVHCHLHTWKEYVGFTRVVNYCIKCDLKTKG